MGRKFSLELTDKQKAILMFCENQKRVVYPTVRQIAKYFGVVPATVQDHLDAIKRKGFAIPQRKA